MIVIDSSAMVEWVLHTPLAEPLGDKLAELGGELHAPHLLDIETTHSLRRMTLLKQIESGRAYEALQDFKDMQVVRYPHWAHLDRIWALRSNLTAYDAVFVALAENLGAPLVTADRKMAAAARPFVRVEAVQL